MDPKVANPRVISRRPILYKYPKLKIIEKGMSTDLRHAFTVPESKLALDLSQSTRSSHMGSMITVYHSSVRTMDPHALISTSFPCSPPSPIFEHGNSAFPGLVTSHFYTIGPRNVSRTVVALLSSYSSASSKAGP